MWGYYGLPRPFPPDSVKRAVLMRGDDWRGDCPSFWTNDINGDDQKTKMPVSNMSVLRVNDMRKGIAPRLRGACWT